MGVFLSLGAHFLHTAASTAPLRGVAGSGRGPPPTVLYRIVRGRHFFLTHCAALWRVARLSCGHRQGHPPSHPRCGPPPSPPPRRWRAPRPGRHRGFVFAPPRRTPPNPLPPRPPPVPLRRHPVGSVPAARVAAPHAPARWCATRAPRDDAPRCTAGLAPRRAFPPPPPLPVSAPPGGRPARPRGRGCIRCRWPFSLPVRHPLPSSLPAPAAPLLSHSSPPLSRPPVHPRPTPLPRRPPSRPHRARRLPRAAGPCAVGWDHAPTACVAPRPSRGGRPCTAAVAAVIAVASIPHADHHDRHCHHRDPLAAVGVGGAAGGGGVGGVGTQGPSRWTRRPVIAGVASLGLGCATPLGAFFPPRRATVRVHWAPGRARLWA